MKRYVIFVFVVLCSIVAAAQTDKVVKDGVCYQIKGNEAAVTKYSDEDWQNNDFYTGKIVIADTITYYGKKYPVTAIAPGTFMLCHNVTEVYLPNTITTIGDEAFKYDNVGLEKMHFGANLREIGKDAFYCTRMKVLDIDTANKHFVLEDGILYTGDHTRAITTIGEGEFYDGEMRLHDQLKYIDGGFALSRRVNRLRFNQALKNIGEYAFCGSFSDMVCQNDLILPDSIEHIGQFAFANCIFIWNLHLPDNLTRLEPYSFNNVAPTYIDMPKNLKVICDGALSCSAGGAYKNLVLPEGLDSIGKYGITSISCDSLVVPSTVRYLSYYSLSNYSRYIEIKAPLDSIATCAMPSSSVKELVLPKTLKRIEHGAFYPCYRLERIVWPDALEYIGQAALAGNKINPMVVPSTVKTIGSLAFSDNVWEPRTYYFTSPTPPTCERNDVFDGIIYEESTLYVPKGCKSAYATTVPWAWFGTIEEYDEIVLPTVTYRYDFAYDGLFYKIVSEEDKTCEVSYDCNYITQKNTYKYKTVTIPETVTYDAKTYTVVGIEDNAFGGTPLEHVNLPETLTYMDGAFVNCENLASIKIPENVTSIGEAFGGCSKLKKVHVPDRVENMIYAFSGCSSLESVDIPANVACLDGAFCDCSNLKSVVIPDHITEIGESTFMRCSHLTSVTLPADLEQIDENAFADCKSLRTIVLPSKLHIIKSGAFEECRSLADIVSLNPEPPYPVGSYIFANIPNTLTVHVPAGSKSAYKKIKEWSYFNIVEDAEVVGIGNININPSAGKTCDLQGRPVDENYKGIVVKEGKLVIRK